MNVPDLAWDEHGVPYSVLFDDKYFCKDNGYEDALLVACGGNRLRERFAGFDPSVAGTFVIVEAGFGTGLNFCCAWKMWKECAPASWKLHFISLEKFPVSADQLARALSLWPLLQQESEALARQYSPVATGTAVFDFDGGRVRLSIVFDDVIGALKTMADQGLAGPGVDALFLHGFAPSKNPDMWTEPVFAGMARLSKPGTTFATFTVAGWVRRGLQAQGFRIRKEKGYGQKKHMLVGEFK